MVPEGSDFHNGSSQPLEDDGVAETLLFRLRQALVLADTDAAADLVRRLRDLEAPSLVPYGPRTLMPALELAARLVAQHDTPELIEGVERDLRAEVEAAISVRDLGRLLDLATRGVELRPSRVAALAAARLLFEEGRWWASAALAGRVADLPGAAELERVARSRVEAGVAADGGAGENGHSRGLRGAARWSWHYAFARDRGPGENLARVTDGRDAGELLVLDGVGLLGVRRELATSGDAVTSWRRVELPGRRHAWVEETLRRPWLLTPSPELLPLLPPEPRQHSFGRAGDVLAVPYNRISIDRTYGENHYQRRAHLIAFDLATERQLWDVAAPALEGSEADRPGFGRPSGSGAPSSSAFGPPLVAGRRIFVQLFRVGLVTEVSLFCYDLDTGEQLFETPLVRGAPVSRYASRQAETNEWRIDKRASEGVLAERHGIVYACTGYGVVAAVDGLTGRPRHTFRYDRLASVDPDRYDPALLFDTGGWDHEPVRIHGDRVVVAPSDSHYLYILAAEAGPKGQLILDDPIERLARRHIVALLPDPGGSDSPAVLVSRVRGDRFGLQLLGPDGHVLEASPVLPAVERVDLLGKTPRPLLVGRQVFMPTALGVRLFDLDALEATPALLDRPVKLSVPLSLHAVRDGIVALSLEPRDRRMMWVECWTARQ